MRNKEFWSFLILMVFALCSESIALDDQLSRDTLKGIQGFPVMVDVASDLREIGITGEQIQMDTELKLRLAGIKVEAKVIPGKPALYIFILGLRIPKLPMESPVYTFYIDVSVVQMVRLERDLTFFNWIHTWSIDYIGVRGSRNPDDIKNHIRDVNKDLVEKFINAYLSANPKEGK
jgi:hypothetical protein